MSDGITKSEKENEHRDNQRYEYPHHLDVTFNNKQWPAKIIDWSAQGIQVLVDAPLDGIVDYEAEFDIHRMSFVPDEEYEDEDSVPPIEEWIMGGKVRWVKKEKGGIAIGISFEENLKGIPLSELPEFITEADLCHLRIFLRNKDSE
ncbi:MAG: PilZ domain-containing protein [SAR324 cluster bacterium]|nr:PilZ domain-containing protein [SAR324 cluster bacterium]